MMGIRVWVIFLLVLFVPTVVPRAAVAGNENADDAEPEGTIVKLERDVAYITLGVDDEIRPGMVLRVFRTITVKHPVTDEVLSDHFPIGKMTIEEVSEVLSFGRIERRIAGVVKVGDVVRIIQATKPPMVDKSAPAKAAQPPAKVTTPPPSASAGPQGTSQDAIDLHQLFVDSMHLSPGQLGERLREFLKKHPNSIYAPALAKEIEVFSRWEVDLRNLQKAGANPKAQLLLPSVSKPVEKDLNLLYTEDLQIEVPSALDAGDPFEIALRIHKPEKVQAAFAYLRRPKDHTYERIRLHPDGDGYYRAVVPKELLVPPSLDLFLEAVDKEGRQVTSGSATSPYIISIEPVPTPPKAGPRGRTEIHGFFDYVDFNRFKGNDYYLSTEGAFSYRPGIWLARVSAGFGVLYGRGGNNLALQLLTDPAACAGQETVTVNSPCGQRAGFNHGYFEVEFEFGKWVGLSPRFQIGQAVQGPGVGGELKLRIGQMKGTNLQLGASYLQYFGALGSLQLEWNVVKNWPMSAAVLVTNLPAQGDVGVRIFYQVAYRARPWLQPALRIGMAARNIEQIGMNLGFGLITAW